MKIPEIPDDDVSPLKPDFGWLGKMILVIILIIGITYLIFLGIANLIVANISISKEKEIFGDMFINEEYEKFDLNKLSYNLQIPENIDIYLSNSEEINAYAVLGGNIILTKGLIENLKYEEELVFIIGHEIAHITSRDIIKGFSKEFPFYITLIFLGLNDSGVSTTSIFDLTSNYFSRKTELNADNGGINFLKKVGGNPYCAIDFFENENDIFQKYLEFNSTHPNNNSRIENIKNSISQDMQNFGKCNKLNY